ncbi:alpha/beta fold hydrolase [Janthinobacterium agaricidamnosum]|uniref:Alpha/beta hydrolase fold family protein n=1 Tax=Janthinobacterium agaricidamnosum NBRC 102515 = DSM 9628 TaxID=1349767 RepID=W0V8W2_9BURK|nr:alpha/beta fold hydrolase [Janthinobacterium agaricidamnosum]CDG85269.1 alpha/beta hydrolase fold family protein [Janthinobacterium agaricidamnosum NBRC 102515 = DSM 9628]
MRFSEDELATLKCCDLVERTIHIWRPEQKPRAVIMALHGGMAHAGDYVEPARYFRAHGFALVSFDMHGHDAKKRVDIPGFDTLLDDAELFLLWVKITYPGLPIFIMGHSMGGLLATHLGLGRFAGDSDIQGFIISSPYYVNAIKVAAPLHWLSGLLAKVAPTMKVPLASLTMLLTHDRDITERHLADERDNLRATEVTVRFAHALTSAQAALSGGAGLAAWRFPLFAVLAGDDKLADSTAGAAILKTVPAELLDYHFYPSNYHENFNELNRDVIFGQVLGWLRNRLSPG